MQLLAKLPDLGRDAIPDFTLLPHGTHACILYDDPSHLVAVAAPFLRQGLDRGERCMVFGTAEQARAILDALVADGLDVDAEERRGAMVVVTEQRHLVDGRFDKTVMLRQLDACMDQALADGFSGLRATGDMMWELGPNTGAAMLTDYEADLDAAFQGRPIVGLCQYRRRDFPPEVLHAVLRCHDTVVLDTQVIPRNPYHEPPFLAARRPANDAASLEWMVRNLRHSAAEDQRRADELRRRTRERLARVLECMSDAFLALDTLGRITFANAEAVRLTGRTVEEIIGKVLWDICPQGPDSTLAHECRRAIADQVPIHVEMRCDGETGERWLDVNGYPMPEGLNLFYRDITERKRAEECQDLLMREVDHRAKNALAVAQSIVMLTRAETIPAFVAAVEGRIAALARVHTLLAKGKWSGAPLAAMVAEELEPFRHGAPDRVTILGPDIRVVADAAQPVTMVLHELATNASKYGALSTPEGRVSVGWAWRPDGRLSLEWRESGGPEVRPPARNGFGSHMIGLAVSGQLDGQVEFDWSGPGLRCVFTMAGDRVVPAATAPGAGSGPVDAAPPRPVSLDGRRVLVVEDDALLAMGMQMAIETLGLRVVGPAATVEAALRLAATESLDAAVLDVNLRGRESWTVADVLAERSIPMVFTTGYGGMDPKAAERGAQVLVKPFHPQQLEAILRGMLS